MSSDSDSEYTDGGPSGSEDLNSPDSERCVGCDFETLPGDLNKDTGLCFSCERIPVGHRSSSSMSSLHCEAAPARAIEPEGAGGGSGTPLAGGGSGTPLAGGGPVVLPADGDSVTPLKCAEYVRYLDEVYGPMVHHHRSLDLADRLQWSTL